MESPGQFSAEINMFEKAWCRGRTTDRLLVATGRIAAGLGMSADATQVGGMAGGPANAGHPARHLSNVTLRHVPSIARGRRHFPLTRTLMLPLSARTAVAHRRE